MKKSMFIIALFIIVFMVGGVKAASNDNSAELLYSSSLIDIKDPKILKTEPRIGDFTNGSNFYIKYTEENLKSILVKFSPECFSMNGTKGDTGKGADGGAVGCWVKKPITLSNCQSGKNQECYFNINLSDYNGQEIKYSVRLIDIANNTKDSKPTKIVIDTTSPKINNPQNMLDKTYRNYAYLNINITEANLDRVEYYDNNDPKAIWRTICTKLKNGLFEKRIRFKGNRPNILIKVLDKAGNSMVEDLWNLKRMANVECLKNSDCIKGFVCVSNNCINSEDLDKCKIIDLSGPVTKLQVGDPINSIKSVLTKADLPSLLTVGSIYEIDSGKLNEYSYTQTIVINDSTIKEEDGKYFLDAKNSSLYTLRIMFSNPIDFSNENIQDQALRLLGKEYIISNKSNNSIIYLVSEEGNALILENGRGVSTGDFAEINGSMVNMRHSFDGEIVMIEVIFSFKDSHKKIIEEGESYVDPVFESSKLKFEAVDPRGWAVVYFGGNC